jgi:hypothetical protein
MWVSPRLNKTHQICTATKRQNPRETFGTLAQTSRDGGIWGCSPNNGDLIGDTTLW